MKTLYEILNSFGLRITGCEPADDQYIKYFERYEKEIEKWAYDKCLEITGKNEKVYTDIEDWIISRNNLRKAMRKKAKQIFNQ